MISAVGHQPSLSGIGIFGKVLKDRHRVADWDILKAAIVADQIAVAAGNGDFLHIPFGCIMDTLAAGNDAEFRGASAVEEEPPPGRCVSITYLYRKPIHCAGTAAFVCSMAI